MSEASKGKRDVDFLEDGRQETEIYNADLLEPGMHFDGPAIIEFRGTTAVVPPHCAVEVDKYGNLHVDIAQETIAND